MVNQSNAPYFRLVEGMRFWTLTVVLWISIINLPEAPRLLSDPSWQVVLMRAHTQGWQFGREIIFTYGPWGFLSSAYHLGREGAVVKLAWEFIGHLCMALGIITLIRDMAAWRQMLFVGAVFLFHAHDLIGIDAIYLLFIGLVVLRRLLANEHSIGGYFFWAATLGLLSQIKFTYAVLSGCGIATAVVLAICHQRWRTAAAILAGSVIAFTTLWMAAGQHLGNLAAYLQTSLEIMRGYDGMAVDERTEDFWAGLVVLLSCLVFLWRLKQKLPVRFEGIATAGFLTLLCFIAWKHAYTRADFWHIPSFFVLILYLAALLPGFYFKEKKIDWLDGTWAICLIVLLAWPFNLAGVFQQAPVRWLNNILALRDVTELPVRWQLEFLAVRNVAGYPALPTSVGNGSVDAYNFNQAELVLQPVNFVPRPVFQSYFSFTPQLNSFNRQHYESLRAPDFVLWRQFTIDGRYPTQDDAELFRIMQQHYLVAGSAKNCVLLKRRTVNGENIRAKETLLAKRSLVLNEVFNVPLSAQNETLWIKAKAHSTRLGDIKAFLYKPSLLYMITEDSTHGKRRWRILPRIAEKGFLLQPLLDNTADFSAFMKGLALPPISRIAFEVSEGQDKFWSGIEIEITTETPPPRSD